MKSLVFCDETKFDTVLPLCKKYDCGIEVQSLCYPSYLATHPDAIEHHIEGLCGVHEIALHGPFHDLCPGSNDELIRDVTKIRFEFAYEMACKVNATSIILHHGYVPKTSSYSGWLKRVTAFWNDFLDGKSDHIRFHVENVLELDPDLISDVISGIRRETVNICLDIGHAYCNSKVPVTKWIEHLNDKIGYVHLHDNNGEYDEHLGLGEGNLPIFEVCKLLDFYCPNAIWAIETSIHSKEKSYLWLKEKGFLG
jgi:sugar phosphate isomerase/epimerase